MTTVSDVEGGSFLPLYPLIEIKVLQTIAYFYGFGDVPEEFIAHMVLNDIGQSNTWIMQKIRPTRFLGLDPSFARSIINRFKNDRNIPSIQTAGPERRAQGNLQVKLHILNGSVRPPRNSFRRCTEG